ncbi:MAG: zf-HC2 domain-containing protein [Holophagales bacterium]|nr:zf-HC2 domain-containing protein [Holophagales bacterium]
MATPFDRRREQQARRAAGQLIGEWVGAGGTHPAAESLIAYQEGTLDPRLADRVREHVESCEACSEELAELEMLDHPSASEGQASPDPSEIARAWMDLQAEMEKDEAGPAAQRPRGGSEPRRSIRSSRRWLLPATAAASALLAAALLVIAGGGFLDGRIEGNLSTAELLAAPWLVELAPDEPSRQRSGGRRPVSPPEAAKVLVLRLLLEDLTPYESYRVRLIEEASSRESLQEEMIRQRRGELLLLVPTHALSSGPHRLELSGLAASGWQRLATYSFHLEVASKGR